MRIARVTHIPATRGDLSGEYVWGGANWFFTGQRPAIKTNPKDLSDMGRACQIVTKLEESDYTAILQAHKLEDWWENQGYHLDEVVMTSPTELKELKKQSESATGRAV